jgi:lycopene cyclase domain-containing protein
MSLYLLLNLGSILLPLIFTFHPRIAFYKKWPHFIPALSISASIYLLWDIWFTTEAVWGFNEAYLIGSYFLHLPLEEWLFFICIPYACVFTHYTMCKQFPNFKLSLKSSSLIGWVLVLLCGAVALYFIERSYTFVNGLLTMLILLLTIATKPQLLQQYLLTFLILLLPFGVVNGLLTGSLITDEVVWYDDRENLGIRLGTIPLEDVFYAFGLVLLTLYLSAVFSRKMAGSNHGEQQPL